MESDDLRELIEIARARSIDLEHESPTMSAGIAAATRQLADTVLYCFQPVVAEIQTMGTDPAEWREASRIELSDKDTMWVDAEFVVEDGVFTKHQQTRGKVGCRTKLADGFYFYAKFQPEETGREMWERKQNEEPSVNKTEFFIWLQTEDEGTWRIELPKEITQVSIVLAVGWAKASLMGQPMWDHTRIRTLAGNYLAPWEYVRSGYTYEWRKDG